MARFQYAAPGVYIEEVNTGTRPIEASGTSVAAFVGKAPDIKARPHEAYACNNWEQFFSNYCVDQEETTDLAQAVESFFDNGGSRCYIVNTGNARPGRGGRPRGVDGTRRSTRWRSWRRPARPTPPPTARWSSTARRSTDRVCILDVPSDVPDLNALTRVADGSLAPPGGGGGTAGAGGDKPPSHRRRRGTRSPRRTRRTPSRITPGSGSRTRSSPMRSG